jgi:lantibiotic modifying enzyme
MIISDELRSHIKQDRLQFYAHSCMEMWTAFHASGENEILSLLPQLISPSEMAVWSAKLLNPDGTLKPGPLYGEYPGLEEILQRVSSDCDIYLDEMEARIEKNRADISRVFFHCEDFGQVTGLSCENADLHRHGRCTAIVQTEKGPFLYRPRDVRFDVFYEKTVRNFFSEFTRAPLCISRDGYGFSEFIPAVPIENESGIAHYFYNFGALAALIRALSGSDIHAENILAAGTFPVLVDLETILRPEARLLCRSSLPAAEESFAGFYSRSLGLSGILPGFGEKNIINPLIGTDSRTHSTPFIGTKSYPVYGYEEDFLRGLRAGYLRCLEIKEDLLAGVRALADVPDRVLIRSTAVYFKLLEMRLSPDVLRSGTGGAKLKQELEKVFISYQRDDLLPVADCERKSLMENDIPIFHAPGGSRDLFCGGVLICRDFFRKSALENAEAALLSMNEDELRFETELFREAFLRSGKPKIQENAQPDVSQNISANSSGSISPDFSGSISPDLLLREAEEALLRLRRHAVTSPAGDISWLAADPDSSLRPMDCGLMNGFMGVGIFASAMLAAENETVNAAAEDEIMHPDAKNKTVHAAAEEILGSVFRQYREMTASFSEDGSVIPAPCLSIGFDRGAAGILLSLMMMGKTDEAVSFARNFLPRLDYGSPAKTDSNFSPKNDLIGGAAGLLQVLCRCPELLRIKEGREAAGRCVISLLENRTLETSYGMLWATAAKDRPLSGMGHGMAGIACALNLARAALDRGMLSESSFTRRDLTGAIGAAVSFEYAVYSEKLKNWPDFRGTPSPDHSLLGFCSGAPGIGLSMLSLIRNGCDTREVRISLERAVEASLAQPLLYRDHLCCGNSARIDFLLEVLREKERPDVREFLNHFLAEMTARKNRTGEYTTVLQDYENAFSAEFFYGVSGIGYEMLRVCDPERFPSVLI